MRNLLVLAVVGMAAQLIDGALGMGYGVTSSSMLLALGVAPAVASASVHAGEVVTTLVSGMAHWRFGNVDRRMMWRLGIPGAVGAFAGAVLLSSFPVQPARLGVSAFLLLLGGVVVGRFARLWRVPSRPSRPVSPRLFTLLGFIGGVLDATGGGGWGPVTTSTLIARQPQHARKVIGSVDASEFLVASAATAGFVLTLGWNGINWSWVAAIVLGGAVAAPVAAWVVRRVPLEILGVTVGAMIVLSNARTLLVGLGFAVPASAFLVAALVPAVTALALLRLRAGQGLRTGQELDSASR
ncbi:MAG: sulfite exporter TauE/SafE family protein [Firmicutes bacterium]|nr:sulfite exporter TauE/SafE family protein [Bacillota bacterium]